MAATKLAYVYLLSDPQTFAPTYIGATTNIAQRVAYHMTDVLYSTGRSKRSPGPLYNPEPSDKKRTWLLSLHYNGLRPLPTCLMTCPAEEKFFWEAFWGEIFQASYNLVNSASFRRQQRLE